MIAVFIFDPFVFSGATPSLNVLRSFTVSAQREGFSKSLTSLSSKMKTLYLTLKGWLLNLEWHFLNVNFPCILYTFTL